MNAKPRKAKKGGSSFLRGVLIYIGIFALAAISILIFLWNFMSAYERSLPEKALIPYTSDGGISLLDEAARRDNDDTALLDYLYPLKLEGREITCRKKAGEYTAAKPVYSILADGEAYFTLTLKEGEEVGFGMRMWEADTLTADEAYYTTERHTLTITAPSEAEVSVNGRILAAADIEADGLRYRDVNPYEASLAELACTKYRVEGLFTPPEVAVIYEGVALTPSNKGDYSYVFLPGQAQTLTVKAPSTATVTVNGYILTNDYVVESTAYTDIQPEEKDIANLPTELTYLLEGIYSTPAVACHLNNTELFGENSDNTYCYSYPESAKYTATVRLPESASLMMANAPVDMARITSKGEAYEVLAGLEAYLGTLPTGVTYTIDGLYLKPTFTAADETGALGITREVTDGYSYTVEFARISDGEHDTEIPLTMLRRYIEYTAYGSSNTQQNYEAVLPYVVSGSPVAKLLRESVESIKWNSVFSTITYNDIGARNFVDYGENCFTCELYCDVQLARWSTERHYVSAWNVTCIKTANGWRVWDMVTK
ncbi:MAG: hypothetical protein J6I45_09770 [Clostridia bacterium]|nr:hypothetical protein [Clostridia bacterium]